MNILPLKGPKSVRALQAFQVLVLCGNMLPEYMGMPREDYAQMADELDEEAKEKLLRKILVTIPTQDEEIYVLAGFVTDKHGVPYSKVNIDNLGPGEIVEILVAVCMALSKIKVTMLTDEEKKN